MKVCNCSLAGTKACNYCSNNNDYSIDSLEYLIKDWNEHYKDKRRVVTRTFTTTHLNNK